MKQNISTAGQTLGQTPGQTLGQTPGLMTRRSFATGSLAAAATTLSGGHTLAADNALARALAPRVIRPGV